MKSKLIIAIVLVLFTITSCKKYPDGPSLSLRSKKERLSNSWVIQAVFVNEVDKTSDFTTLYYKNFVLDVRKDGTYNSSYLYFNLLEYSEAGTWTWSGDKKQVYFNKITNGTSSGTHLFDILKLKEKECWIMEKQSNGDVWKWHMKPQ